MSSTSGSSSSSPSQHYATLLSTVVELRTDLEKTLSKLTVLEGENSVLQSNYQKAKDELMVVRKQMHEAKDNYMTTVSEKLELESQYQVKYVLSLSSTFFNFQ